MNLSPDFLPDGSWPDPLTRKERRGYGPMTGRMARRLASAEMSDLHLDVTERAKAAAS